MKLFICSDAHGNIRALDAVLDMYREMSPCGMLFLGDAVGYGSHPAECLERLLSLKKPILILGNHDRAVLDEYERENFHEEALQAIEWTRLVLGGKYDDRIRKDFNLTVSENVYSAAHGSPLWPEEFPYIFSPQQAHEAFDGSDFSICFVGHTHIPMVYTYNGGPKSPEPGVPYPLDPSDRYIINPGSVGQPRDGDNRASFMVFETEERTVTLHRCAYDIGAEAEDISRAGLPDRFAQRLFDGV